MYQVWSLPKSCLSMLSKILLVIIRKSLAKNFCLAVFLIVGYGNALADNIFDYEVTPDGASITGCLGECPSQLVIPGIIDGHIVTGIGDYAFYKGSRSGGDLSIVSVTLPNTLTTIGDWAFSLQTVSNLQIPDSVTVIGDYAFSSNFLTGLVIPDSVQKIGTAAFSGNLLLKFQVVLLVLVARRSKIIILQVLKLLTALQILVS